MTRGEVQRLQHGLYIVYWHTGGSSLASVGSDPKGQRWLAPTNWVSGSTTALSGWCEVRAVELVYASSELNRRDQGPNYDSGSKFTKIMSGLRIAAGYLLWAVALTALVISINS